MIRNYGVDMVFSWEILEECFVSKSCVIIEIKFLYSVL